MLRELRESDVDAVLEVYRRAWGDGRPIDSNDLRSWLRNPELDSSTLRVLEIDGEIAGYGDVTVADGVVALEVAAPNHWDTFLSWAENEARQAGASRVRALSYTGESLANAAAARGYILWRSAYRMQLDLGMAALDEPALPERIELRPYGDDDADRLLDALNEVFAPDPFFVQLSQAQFRETFLNDPRMDPSLWVLAWGGEDLAGFALGFAGWHGKADVGEVQSVGVRAPWRRRGLGEALVRSTFRLLLARGLRSVTLGVDASNETGAVRLYKRLGMRNTAQYDNWALDLGDRHPRCQSPPRD
jgi:mycothiol synthase